MSETLKVRLPSRIGFGLATAFWTHIVLVGFALVVSLFAPASLVLVVSVATMIPFISITLLTFCLSYLVPPSATGLLWFLYVLALSQVPTAILLLLDGKPDFFAGKGIFPLFAMVYGFVAAPIAWLLRKRLIL